MSGTGWEPFSRTLRAFRHGAGHASARAFYQAAGGRAHFGCTYRQYLNVENGLSAPGTRLVERIALALSLMLDPDRAKEFVIAYLQCLISSEKLLGLVLKTMEGRREAKTAPEAPLRRSMVRNFQARSKPLTQAQSDCACSKFENYWIFTLLANDNERWSPERLAKATGFPEAAVLKSLKALGNVKLVESDTRGTYGSPFAGKVVLHPRDDIYAPRLEKLRGNWDRMAAKQGHEVMRQHLFTRASEAELRDYFPHLIQSVQAADICTTDRHGPDTAFFLIESTVRKIMAF